MPFSSSGQSTRSIVITARKPDVVVGNTGECNYITDGVADQVQIAQAIAELANKGVGKLLPIDYNLTDELLFTGTGLGAGADPDVYLIFLGSGWGTRLVQGGVSKHVIHVKNNFYGEIGKFKVIQPAANSGHGVFGDKTGVGSDVSFGNGKLHDIYSFGGDATHSPFYFINPFWTDMENLWGRTGAGDAMVFENDGIANYGNVTIKHGVLYSPSGKYMITVKGTTGIMNYLTFEGRWNMCCPSGGVKLRGDASYNDFLSLDLEQAETGILFDAVAGKYARHNYFHGFLTVKTNQTGIDADSATAVHGGNVFDLDVWMDSVAAGTYLLKDRVGWQPSNEYAFRFINQDPVAGIFSINSGGNARPKIRWFSGSRRNPNGGVANIADGATIAHNIGVTPTWWDVKTTVAGEYARATGDATNLTVAIKTFAGGVGSVQDIQWKAGYYNE